MVQFARGNNLPRVKLSNQSSILRMIYHCGPIKRAEISKRLGLTLPTITTNVNDMIAEGIVRETDCQNADLSSPGRRARPVEIVPESRHFVGVEIQEYRRTVCVLNFRGETIVQRTDELHLTDYAQSMERTCAVVQQALAEAGLRLDQVNGICLCLPGLVNSGSGILDTCPRFGWSNKNIVADAAALIGYRGPIMAENNACARAYGAQLFHHEKLDGAKTFAYLLVSCGIACPLVLNTPDQLAFVVGAGEVGHMIMEPNGRLCSCGNQGCLEAYSSKRAVIDRCTQAIHAGGAPVLRKLCPADRQPGMREILAAQEAADPDVCRIIEEALYYLGLAVININHFACPPVMMIDGDLFCREENRAYLLETDRRNRRNPSHAATRFVFLEPDAFSGARGAAARAIFKNMEAHVD